jgi:hypothetical protein
LRPYVEGGIQHSAPILAPELAPASRPGGATSGTTAHSAAAGEESVADDEHVAPVLPPRPK